MVQSRLGGSCLTMGGAYLERKCQNKECGKTFMCTHEHAYGFFCSWHCLRECEKEDGRKSKKSLKTQEAEMLEKIKKCESNIEHYRQIAEAAKPGTKVRNNANRYACEWRYRLEDAQIMLDQIRKRMHG